MGSEFKIDWKEINLIWEKFEGNPLLEEIHVIRFEISKNMEFIQAKLDLLSEDELKKSARFARQADRNSFFASAVMKKILCATYLHIEPQAVEFEKNEYNKPKIKIRNDIHFNTSHSGDWLVFIFSSKHCGIDIEKINIEYETKIVMESSFHADEIVFIQNSKNPISEFFRIWTVKEAFLKALGTGLSDHLKELNTLEDFSNLPSYIDQWHIKSLMIQENYWYSICFQNPFSKIKFFEY